MTLLCSSLSPPLCNIILLCNCVCLVMTTCVCDAEPEVLFIGDSMVQLMQQYEIWRELFSPLHALNFGIGGDTTCNVLWRMQNGELDNIRPKVTVVWVGTNNHKHSAEQVAGGILAIAQLLTSRLPKTKVVVLVSEGFQFFLSTVYLEYNISISCSVCIQKVELSQTFGLHYHLSVNTI
uniref:Platelet-activating factor acetylhydrolase IB subunit alpha2 n=1 Tax=Hucho hucho TaxID=62062 RepID=A0A4W5JUB7_9TELE